jgi:TetR/AcrR family transcriptional regulator
MAPRDAEATKERILTAALAEFSEKGIAGARVDAIAARARVNKRMLYYYFGSKDELFQEILRRRLVERPLRPGLFPLAERQRGIEGEDDYIRLLMWEALQGPAAQPANAEPRRAFFGSLIDTAVAAQREGLLPDDLDPAQYVLSELLLVMGPFVLPQLTQLVTGFSVHDPEFLERRREFLDRLERRLRAPVTVRD